MPDLSGAKQANAKGTHMASGMRFLIPFLGLVTAGCFIPPALTIANFAADTMIYLATGKGTADHALSGLTKGDCRMSRMTKGQPICRRVARTAVDDLIFEEVNAYDERPGPAVDAGKTSVVELTGFPKGTELFGLVQDDGTLEIFAHMEGRDAASAPYIEGPTFTVDGYAGDPASFTGVLLNSSYHPFETIIRSS
ncbi:MAG: hypothetical protein IIC57_10940 [Proteobacteria bacterium]|nr:hypothetical protein [Pseudomonadota bacterium]